MEKYSVRGVSYAGEPRSNTALYITAKVAHLLENLRGVENCIVFAQAGMVVPEELREKHQFRFSDNPQLAYAQFAEQFAAEMEREERKLRYLYKEPGYYISETAVVGEDAYIEPGCLIGHHVVIGDHARILAGAVIKNAIIGNWFLANEYAAVGMNGFTMAENEQGNRMRIPSLGRVLIGDCVEIGAHDNISRGSGGDTVIEDNVKVDTLVHIAHDVHLRKNVEITAGSIVGGYTDIGKGAFLGVNCALRNRIQIGDGSVIGMGSTVIHPIRSNVTAAGNPARILY